MGKQGPRHGRRHGDRRAAPVTLASLAEELGVHVSTVSRALSDEPTGVSPTTVEEVREVAARRGYRRNVTARALRTGRSHAVGMTVPRLTDVVLAAVYGGVDEAAIAAGYTTFVANTLDDDDLRRQRVDMILARQVDGMIIADSHHDGTALLDQLAADGIPTVLALRRIPGRLSVSTDDLAGGRLVAEHFLSLGRTRVGVVAGDTRASTGRERTQGFLDTFAAAGIEVPEQVVVPSLFDVRSGALAAARLLDADPDVTAIFAASDGAAVGVMAELRARGRAVPDDVAVAGYNDLDIAGALPVPLTSVDSRLAEVGQLAMGTLLELIDGGSPDSRLLAPRLVVRASTARDDPAPRPADRAADAGQDGRSR